MLALVLPSILTTLPLVIAPFTSSPVKAVVAVGYISSPGNASGVLPIVKLIFEETSSLVSCFLIS